MRTFALALLAAVAAAAVKEATGPAVGSDLTTKINLEASTTTKTTSVTVGGEVTFAVKAANSKQDTAELAVCFAKEADKEYYCAAAAFVQTADAQGSVYGATANINVLKSTAKPAATDFSDAALYASSGSANFKASKWTAVASPAVSANMVVTSDNTTAASFTSANATGADKDSWTWGAANTICSSKLACKFKATRAKAAADEKAANAELEAVRTFAKTTVSAAAWAADSGNANATWKHGDAADTDLSAGVAKAAAAAGAMSLGAVAAAIATLSMAF